METKRLITESLSLNGFEHIDLLIWLIYIVLVVSVSIFMCKNKESKQRTAKEFFIANHSLPWWAMGATLIAVNISAEQFIGMTGTCFKYGIAVAAYEIMAAVTLIIIAKYYIPIYWNKRCYTITHMLRLRYNGAVGTGFSIIWILTYTLLTLTSVAWLGSIAIEHLLGLHGCVVNVLSFEISIRTVLVTILMLISGFYSVWGGQNAIAWTDVLHFIFIMIGGLITAYFTLCAVGGQEGTFIDGIEKLYSFFHTSGHSHDMHTHLIMRRSSDAEGFSQLPGIGMLVGGLWIINMCYWGFNQIFFQKVVSCEGVNETRKGMIFTAFLKLIMPIIILVPSLCAYYFMENDNSKLIYNSTITESNDTMAWIISNSMPTGIKGLFFASLTAAIVSSLASVSNSTATLFTLDIYKKIINKKASERQLVSVARIAATASLTIAALAIHPLIDSMEDGFAFIQETSSYIYPALMTLMTLGLFWRKATTKAAVTVAIATIPLGVIFKTIHPDMPYLCRIGYIYIIDVIIMLIVSLSNTRTVPSYSFDKSQKRMMIQQGYMSAGIALAFYLIATVAFVGQNLVSSNSTINNNAFIYLNDIGIDSLFIGATILVTFAITDLSNGYAHRESPSAIGIELSWFKTDKLFSALSITIVSIVTFIYILLW